MNSYYLTELFIDCFHGYAFLSSLPDNHILYSNAAYQTFCDNIDLSSPEITAGLAFCDIVTAQATRELAPTYAFEQIGNTQYISNRTVLKYKARPALLTLIIPCSGLPLTYNDVQTQKLTPVELLRLKHECSPTAFKCG
ncbi:hypothetical protein [Vibrio parahaemolyticus]|uniref:hypothetical protein n=1 Tax=Vibrio parahaemolyticus TaxID=670 RepID=UPI003892048E